MAYDPLVSLQACWLFFGTALLALRDLPFYLLIGWVSQALYIYGEVILAKHHLIALLGRTGVGDISILPIVQKDYLSISDPCLLLAIIYKCTKH
jgi:hypothetical protein